MEYQVHVTYSPRFYQRNLYAWAVQYVVSHVIYAAPAIAAFLFLAFNKEFAAMLSGAFVIGALFGASAVQITFYVIYLRNAIRKYLEDAAKWYGRQVLYELSEEKITFKSDDADQVYPWKLVERLTTAKDQWTLSGWSGAHIVFPLESMDEDIKQFIRQKVYDADGEVVKK